MKKTRFKIALVLLAVFLIIIAVCFFLSEAYVGIIERSIAAIMIVAPAYILGDSYRKSDK